MAYSWFEPLICKEPSCHSCYNYLHSRNSAEVKCVCVCVCISLCVCVSVRPARARRQ